MWGRKRTNHTVSPTVARSHSRNVDVALMISAGPLHPQPVTSSETTIWNFMVLNQLLFFVVWLQLFVFAKNILKSFACLSIPYCFPELLLLLYNLVCTFLHLGAESGGLHIFTAVKYSTAMALTTGYFSIFLSMYVWIVFSFASLNKIYLSSRTRARIYLAVKWQGQNCMFSFIAWGQTVFQSGCINLC